MGLLGLLAVLAVVGLIFGPSAYVRYVLARHGGDRADIEGTGGDLARHLVERFGLDGVSVEAIDPALHGTAGDHYDPDARAVRLSPRHHDGRSVAALAVAAHEVGHAVQHARGEAAFAWRSRIVTKTIWLERIGMVVFLLAPVVFLVVKAPALALAQIGFALLLVLARVAVHVVTLPVEFDASFGKALPILADGYLPKMDLPAARTVLKAAAFTYVAGALVTLLDLARLGRLR